MNRALLALPFVILITVVAVRLAIGPGYALLPVLAVAPAVAAALGGVLYTAVVGALTIGGEWLLFAAGVEPVSAAQQQRNALIVISAVTFAGMSASYLRLRGERQLREIQAIADVTQRVVLRPVPDWVGPVRLSAGYVSAASRARVGGDLYAAVHVAGVVRLIVGDAEGKGLHAVQYAAAAMAAFRLAAYEESTLAAVADRIEEALIRDFGEEQFLTAVLADVGEEGEMTVLNCGHPQPLRLGPLGPDLLGPGEGGLPIGLGRLAAARRIPFTVPWEAGEPVLFYTDGLTEARDRAGNFFSLTGCASIRSGSDPATLIERLSAEVGQFADSQQDDMALLLVWRPDSAR